MPKRVGKIGSFR